MFKKFFKIKLKPLEVFTGNSLRWPSQSFSLAMIKYLLYIFKKIFKTKPSAFKAFTGNNLRWSSQTLALATIGFLGGWEQFCEIAPFVLSEGAEKILPQCKSNHEIKVFFNENKKELNQLSMFLASNPNCIGGKKCSDEDKGYSYDEINRAANSNCDDKIQESKIFIEFSNWVACNAIQCLCYEYHLYTTGNST